LENEINQVDQQLNDLAGARQSLITYKNELTKRLALNRVKYGMGEEAGLTYLQGFCPAETVSDITKTADQEGWGYIVQDPDDPAEVPTLIKNPKWIRMVQPILNFMGTLPGYHEQDVSLVFLAFITIFFAMIVGDGGYGLIFLICTYLLGRKAKDESRDFIHLMYLFSIATMLWGLITGNWFGVQAIGRMPVLRNFIIPQIDAYSAASTQMIMQISFIIGVAHLTIARLLSAYRNRRTLNALGDIGYVIVLWAVFFVANNLILKKPLPGITPSLLIVGVILIAVFANFQKNILKGILITMGSLPFGVIGAFADIVSYIRLFAVGLASYIVANSFNTLAVGEGINTIVSGIIAAIILFLAHALNIVLSGMSVLVHGVRLNMLEFSSHVGIQWAGKPYKPFKE
jgi:V/A-type H+-transporting ATPase subunit I